MIYLLVVFYCNEDLCTKDSSWVEYEEYELEDWVDVQEFIRALNGMLNGIYAKVESGRLGVEAAYVYTERLKL